MSPLIIAAIIILLFVIILCLPIGIGAKYEKGTFVLVKIAFCSFSIPINRVLRTKKEKKKEKEKKEHEKEAENDIEKGITGLDFILSLFGDFRRFVRKRFSLSSFELEVVFGTGDAASTAVCTGHLWSLSYNLLALIDKLVYVEEPKVSINPVFNDATFSAKAKGIIKTRLAHIIATAIVFAYKLIKYKRNKTRRKTI